MNSIVLDLNKAQWCHHYYRNQYGQTTRLLPHFPTVRGQVFDAHHMHISGMKTMLEYATEHRLLDRWKPECKFQLSANHNITYTGKKATVMWKEWNRRIFKKK